MFRLDQILKQLLRIVKAVFGFLGWMGKTSDGQKAFEEIKHEVERRRPPKHKTDASEISPEQRFLYRTGYILMLGMLVLTLVLFVFQGSFHREWINPYSPTGQMALQALHPNQLALALFGTVGIPPFVIAVSLAIFLFGWLLMFHGLQTAHPSYGVGFVAVYTGQIWFLFSGHPALQFWLPLVLGGVHLVLCSIGYFRPHHLGLQRFLYLLQSCMLLAIGVFLWFWSPSRMSLMLGLSTTQISTIILLVIYWYLLGRDALDGSVVIGQWYGFFSLRFLRGTTIAIVTLGLLLLGALPFLRQETFLLPFGIAVCVGCALLLLQWARSQKPPVLFAINLFLLSFLLLVVAPRAMSAYLAKEMPAIVWFGIFSPVMLYIYSTVWSFYSSGPLFIQNATKKLPASARMFIHIGWVLLATNCLLFFVAARDNLFTTLSVQITSEAFLIVGIPFFLYVLYRSWTWILIDRLPDFASHETTKQPSHVPPIVEDLASHTEAIESSRHRWYIPGYVFVGMSILLLFSVHWVRGLSFITYAKVSYHMARGNIALRQNRYGEAVTFYEKAQQIDPYQEKPYALKAVALEALGRKADALEALEHATKLRPDTVDIWLQKGALLRQKREYAKALLAYDQARQLDPSDSFIYRNIGLCYSHMGQYTQAVQYLNKALALMPGTNEFGTTHYAALGSIYIQAKQYDKAESVLLQALRLNRHDFLAHSDLSILYQKQKPPRWQQAHHHIQQAVRLRPEKIELLDQLASLTKTRIQHQPQHKATLLGILFRAYEDSLQRSPEDQRILTKYIDNTLEYQAFAQAKRVFVTLRKRPNMQPLVQIFEARIAMRQGRYQEADRHLQALLQRYPNHLQGLYFRGQLYQMTKNYTQAIALYQRVLRQHVSHEMALLNTVISYRVLGRYAQAITACRNLLHHHPKHTKGWFEMALLHQIQKRYVPALQYYHRILTEQGEHTDALRNVAVTLNITNQCQKALPYYARYFKSTTQPASIMYYSWAHCYYRLQQYEKAIPLYQRYVREEPTRWFAHYFLGLNHQMLRQYAQAIVAYRKVLSLRPNDYSTLLNLAKIYRFSGQFQDAKNTALLLLKLRPKDRHARMELVFQAQAQKQYKVAIYLLRSMLRESPKDGTLWGQLAFVLAQSRDYRQAYRVSLQWLQAEPNRDDAWSGVIVFETYQLRQYAKVSQRCQQWSQLPQREKHPRYVTILYACAWAAQQQPTQQAIAIQFYQRILQATQNRSTAAAIYVADLYRQQNQRPQQIHYLRLATDTWPQNILYRFHLALALQQTGMKSQANTLFQQISSALANMNAQTYAVIVSKTKGLPLTRLSFTALQQYLSRSIPSATPKLPLPENRR